MSPFFPKLQTGSKGDPLRRLWEMSDESEEITLSPKNPPDDFMGFFREKWWGEGNSPIDFG